MDRPWHKAEGGHSSPPAGVKTPRRSMHTARPGRCAAWRTPGGCLSSRTSAYTGSCFRYPGREATERQDWPTAARPVASGEPRLPVSLPWRRL